MAEDTRKVRLEERLKIKIGEAKNLPARSHGAPTHRDTYCVLSLDQEEIFRTSTMERTLNPFFGEEFQFEVPRCFRYLSIYVFDRDRDRHLKQDKVLGKVAIRREELQSYNNKDHWFVLRPVDADSEVQGKAHIEILFEETSKITSISPDYHPGKESPRISQRSNDERNTFDEMTASNLSVDRKTSKGKILSKNITEYYKFGSCSSTSSKRLLSSVTIPENLSGLARSESLKTQQSVQHPSLHHTYGPSCSRNRQILNGPDSLRSESMHSHSLDSDVSVMGHVESNYISEHSPIEGPQYLMQPDLKNKLSIRVLECSELTLKNGQCDPYAIVTVVYSNDKKVSKKTKVKKKTVNPQFDECFVFDLTLESDAGKERDSNNAYTVWPAGSWGDAAACEVCVSLWHDAPGMGGEAMFLGEVRAPLRASQQLNTSAWYFLRSRSGQQCARGATPPGTRLSCTAGASLGSLRLLLHHTQDHVLPPPAYEDLRKLLLQSASSKHITSSAVYILGEIVSSKTDAAQPLVRLFTHDDMLVPTIRSLADAELSTLTDATTIFRGNTLVSKMMDEAMRLVGLSYLQQTLRPTLDLILSEKKPCEIDPTRVKDPGTVETNLANLKDYVEKMFEAITQSFIHCPLVMCRLLDALRQCASKHFPRRTEVRYSVVSGFIFLRFFAPAILGPRLFNLTTEQIDPQTNRTLTLISKTIQSLGNLVSSQICKEEYMMALYKCFSTEKHVQAIKRFLEIISSSTETQNSGTQDTPVLLKEGMMIKKPQGRKRFPGLPHLKQRHFRLTSCELSYSKARGKRPLCSIPLASLVSAQPVPEAHSLKMNYMFQIDYGDKVLNVQAGNSVEMKEWLDLLGKLCEGHQPPPHKYHSSIYIQGHWPCCSATKADAPGCTSTVPARSPPAGIRLRLDPARDLQRLHCLLYSHMADMEELLLPPRLGNHGPSSTSLPIEDVSLYHKTLRDLKEVTYKLEQQHRAYQRLLARETKYGSKQAPIGDDNYLHLAARANVYADGQQMAMSPVKYFHNSSSSPTPPRVTVPRPLHAYGPSALPPKQPIPEPSEDKPIQFIDSTPKKAPLHDRLFNNQTYLNNSLHIGSSSESVKLSEKMAEERLSGRSAKSAGSGYLKMTALKSEESEDATATPKGSVVSSVQEDRLQVLAPAKAPCEYVEVSKPKMPERDTKPKTGILTNSVFRKMSATKENQLSLEEMADNPQYYCQEYELMSNFSSAAKKRLSSIGDIGSPIDIPPAVPPRSHYMNTPVKCSVKPYAEIMSTLEKLKKMDREKADAEANRELDEVLSREYKSLEQYQTKPSKCPDNPLRIVESGDFLNGEEEPTEEAGESSEDGQQARQEVRSQSDRCDVFVSLKEKSDIQSSFRNSSEVTDSEKRTLDDAAPGCSSGSPTEREDQKKGKVKGQPKEETGFFSRKSMQRKSIPIKSKLSSKKTNSVDGAIGSEPMPAKSTPALTDRLTPSFMKKKTKVTDPVRLQPIC